MTAAFFFTGMAACIKAISSTIPLYEMVFFRSAISVLLLSLLMLRRGTSFRAKNLPLMVTRSLAGLIAMTCNFYALGHLAFGDVAMLVHTFPLFVALLSFLFLGERLTRSLLFWIFIAMLGIALILKPQLNFFNYAGWIALLASFFTAVVVVVVHQSSETDPSLRIAFYFTATCTLVGAAVMAQHFVLPNLQETLYLLGAGLLGTGGQIVMTRAYGMEDVSRLSPLAYVGVVLSFIVGILFWNEIPTLGSMIGSLIVILCCIQIARIEKPGIVVD